MNYLVDTDVISEFRKRNRANPRVVNWFRKRKSSELFLSVLTIGELRRGVERICRLRTARLTEFLKNRLPEGPKCFPGDVFTDQPGIFYVKVKERCIRNDFLIREFGCAD